MRYHLLVDSLWFQSLHLPISQSKLFHKIEGQLKLVLSRLQQNFGRIPISSQNSRFFLVVTRWLIKTLLLFRFSLAEPRSVQINRSWKMNCIALLIALTAREQVLAIDKYQARRKWSGRRYIYTDDTAKKTFTCQRIYGKWSARFLRKIMMNKSNWQRFKTIQKSSN